ncbi:pyridoxamine 5'-phosphate oxidase family protein [Undibacterium flavidum]|uniref:Pyridoxamine 5'-phosphate oxidase family protein n=1 Tax=Undibacterium flavidum TaxID=2762297 RepID=A0ABR6YAW6_9BURK|nr:pyridoxamine 5'-phosphate oxidase family protein [Undibacterium flavidum]MBC3873352.1 pyridoxamine 5'-phosphate oxidase family protein [Undibacterium flavidum]
MRKQYEYTSDIAFTSSVKALQARKGSRHAYARMEQNGSWESTVTSQLRDFIAMQTSFYMATANADGQPYIQHRGGPAGFLHVLDGHRLAFVDFSGNKQFISQGNLAENPQVHLFLMDYAHRQRIKIWGEATVIEDDPALLASLMPENYSAKPEQVVVIRISAWDANCPQHIPMRFDAVDVKKALDAKDLEIARLTQELVILRSN